MNEIYLFLEPNRPHIKVINKISRYNRDGSNNKKK